MKKVAIFKIIMFSIVSIMLIGILVYGITNRFDGFSFGGTRFHYANASSYEIAKDEITISDQDIKDVEVNWMGGSVKIEYTNEESIRFKENYNNIDENSDYFMRYLVKNNKLTIQFCKPKWFVKKSVRDNKNLSLYLPTKIYNKLDISSIDADISYQGLNDTKQTLLKIDGVSGNISIEDAYFTNLDIDNVSGKINLSNVECNQEIKVDTVSANIIFENVKATDLDIDCVSSKINISGIINNMSFDGVSNHVTLTMNEAPKRIDSDTVSGNFILTMPENDGFTATIDSVSGNINSNFEVTYSKKQIVYKNGSFIYKFDSISGDVSINKQKNNELVY